MGMKRRTTRGLAHAWTGDDVLTACGRVADEGDPAPEGVQRVGPMDYSLYTWNGATCPDCLAVKPHLLHHVKYKGTPVALCDDESRDLVDEWKLVTCAKCIAKTNPNLLLHWQWTNSAGRDVAMCRTKGVPRTTEAARVQCPKCLILMAGPTIPPILEKMAETLITKAVVAARNDGFKMTRGHCPHCSQQSFNEDNLQCIPCSLIKYRGRSVKEDEVEYLLGEILGMPHQWVLDFIGGTDGDAFPDVLCVSAWDLGMKLWGKHGSR